MAKNKAIVQNINGIQFTLTSMPIAELKAFRNPSNNYRFDGSENVGGQTVKDSYDLQSLIEWILETKSIGDPIVLIDAIGENEVKQKILVRGNRRTASLEQIESMKLDSIQVKELLENVPVLVYTGPALTVSQVQSLRMDQTNKRYLESEIVRGIFQSLSEGMDEEQIIDAFGHFYTAQLSAGSKTAKPWLEYLSQGKYDKKAKIAAFKLATISTYCSVVQAHGCGPMVRDAALFYYLKSDGLIGADAKHPILNWSTNLQKKLNTSINKNKLRISSVSDTDDIRQLIQQLSETQQIEAAKREEEAKTRTTSDQNKAISDAANASNMLATILNPTAQTASIARQNAITIAKLETLNDFLQDRMNLPEISDREKAILTFLLTFKSTKSLDGKSQGENAITWHTLING
jgi:hypothetical protein